MRLKIVKSILWFLFGSGTVVGLARFIHGLGATTNLTDVTPWGLWIGFDVMGGVALAAGGFVVAGTVYIFHLERYRPILRAAVLTAFLGYLAVAVGLLFDLGLPWNIWHMIIFWNPHSPLFEVGWCVMLYLTVLFLEFAPVWLEKTKYTSLLKTIKNLTVPLVILGVMLSTLHQSSLGSLMLIMPFRVHPLWYSPLIPVMFFVSAIGLGLMMVTLESIATSWLYRKEAETHLLAGLGKAAAYVLSFYVLLKMGDLVYQGKFALMFANSWESNYYIFEILFSALVPAALLFIPKVRSSRGGQLTCALMVVIGFVMNRINISGIATVRATGSDYFPSLMEISVSLWVVSGAILVFLFFIENFKVWETEAKNIKGSDVRGFSADPSSAWCTSTMYDSVKRYSLMLTAGAIFAFALLPDDAVNGPSPVSNPVSQSRIAGKFLIDGNRQDMAVVFDHTMHKDKNGGDDSCVKCHHMNKPLSEFTSCSECHSDMFLETDIFDHSKHLAALPGNDGCIKCHTNPDQQKLRENTTECSECHEGMRKSGTIIKVSAETREYFAPGYKESMHGLCITCHEQKAVELNRPELDDCAACHKDLPYDITKKIDRLYQKKAGN